MIRRLVLTIVLAAGFADGVSSQSHAADLTQPICESLFYKADPQDKTFTLNVVGDLAPGGDNVPKGAVVFVWPEGLTLNVLDDPSPSVTGRSRLLPTSAV